MKPEPNRPGNRSDVALPTSLSAFEAKLRRDIAHSEAQLARYEKMETELPKNNPESVVEYHQVTNSAFFWTGRLAAQKEILNAYESSK